MKDFILNLVPASPLIKAPNIIRRFQGAKVDSLSRNVLEILIVHNLRSLELSEQTIDKQVLSEALGQMKMLENLSVEKVSLEDISRKVDVEPVWMNQLKCLSIVHSDNEILRMLSTESLKRLSFRTNKTIGNELMDLLVKQTQLETLKLAGNSVYKVFFQDKSIAELPFKLKCLNIRSSDSHEYITNLTSFIGAQKNSLMELSIKCKISEPETFYILENLVNLKALQFPIDITSTEDFHRLQPMKSLKQLKPLSAFTIKVDWMRIFPSIEVFDATNFKLNRWLIEALKLLPVTATRLQGLRVPRMTVLSGELLFQNLKEFHVSRIVNEVDFNRFIKRHSGTLEKLSIGQIHADHFSRGVMTEAIKTCKQLRHISITTDSPFVTRKLAQIKMDHPWTLESKFKTLRGHETEWVKIVFNLPDDSALLEERCTVWDDNLIREFTRIDHNYGLNVFVNSFK